MADREMVIQGRAQAGARSERQIERASLLDLPRDPWSLVGPEFIDIWGYQSGRPGGDHLEILGPNGTGKTYFEAKVMQDRADARNTTMIFIATKPVDATILMLGWPIVTTWRGVTENRQCIYWPRTELLGVEKEAWLESRILDLLEHLWQAQQKAQESGKPLAPVVVAFDEVATSEELSIRVRKMIRMYWREARSMGITMIAMKQRPQGALRDMHSEASWVVAFQPKDEEDGMRVAQVMGNKNAWLPVLMGLNREKHECVLLHAVTRRAVITWIDEPLRPAEPPPPGLYKGGSK
jgi:KaiC/GvpD/RAD55 family RecA-like ATPase